MDVAERQRAPDTLPAFQRLQHALQNEPRFAEEVALGRRVGAYKFIKDIGRGNFSKVKLAAHQLTRDNVAVKIVDRSRLDTRAQRMLEVEVLALDSLRHSNILRLFEVIEMWNRVYLITEFIAGGELYNKISLDGPIGESQALVLFRQLIAAVKYMHSNFFVHRDIKAENVLLVSETKVKLADFGFSTKLKEPLEKLDTFCGSPPYAAPELFTEDHYIGQLVDVWALGVLLYFMVVGNMPFRAPTVPALSAAVLRGHYLLPSTLSLPCGRVIQRILVQSPLHRPSLDDLTNSQWMRLGAIEEPHRVATGQPKKAASRFGVFWRRNSTQRNSGRKMRKVDEVLPIACSTKRTESVLATDYLFPLGEEEVGGGNSETVGAPSKEKEKEKEKRPSRRSMFSSLGLGLKTRIGPMDSTTAVVMVKGGGGDDTVNANNVLEEEKKPKHSSDDNIEVCGENSKDFETAPTFKGESPEEVEALRILNNWGISNAMLEEALPSGARNELMGIYRIVVHRLQMQRERQAAATVTAGQIKTKESGGVSARKGGRSKDKGGGCAGKCSGNNSNCVIL